MFGLGKKRASSTDKPIPEDMTLEFPNGEEPLDGHLSEEKEDAAPSIEKPVHHAMSLEFPNGEELLDCDERERQAE